MTFRTRLIKGLRRLTGRQRKDTTTVVKGSDAKSSNGSRNIVVNFIVPKKAWQQLALIMLAAQVLPLVVGYINSVKRTVPSTFTTTSTDILSDSVLSGTKPELSEKDKEELK